MSTLQPTPLRVLGWLVGSFGLAWALRKSQDDLAAPQHPNSTVSELDKASQETTGKIWFGEEENSSSSKQ